MGSWVSGRLLCLGIWESLQLQRCVVLFVLDDTHKLWAKVLHCLVLNGCVFLGSLAWWLLALQPLVHWLIVTQVAPVTGTMPAAVIESTLHLLYHVCWLVPVYLVTLAVSCSWYNEMATIALQVLYKHKASLVGKPGSPDHANQSLSRPNFPGERLGTVEGPTDSGHVQKRHPTLKPSPKAAAAGFEEVAAQEVFRVVLFLVFYGEIWVLGRLPYVGQPLYFLYSCWLCAYYCFDYAWALHGISLQDRLAFFESSAAFFAGYGLLMTLITMLLPFYIGAAITALLFPLFVLVACHSDPPTIIAAALFQNQQQGQASHNHHCQQQLSGKATDKAGPRWPGTWRVPIFAMALRPTKWLLHRLVRTFPGSQHGLKTA